MPVLRCKDFYDSVIIKKARRKVRQSASLLIIASDTHRNVSERNTTKRKQVLPFLLEYIRTRKYLDAHTLRIDRSYTVRLEGKFDHPPMVVYRIVVARGNERRTLASIYIESVGIPDQTGASQRLWSADNSCDNI